MLKKQIYEMATVEGLKESECKIIGRYTREIMQMLMSHSTIISFLTVDTKYARQKHNFETAEGMRNALSELMISYRQFEGLAKNPDKYIKELGPRFKTNVERYGIVHKFMIAVYSVLSEAAKIEKLMNKKIDKDNFIQTIAIMNKKIEDVLVKAISELSVEENSGFDIDNCLEMLHCLSADFACIDYSDIVREKQAELAVASKEKQVEVVRTEAKPNEKEMERISKINEANDMFERFKLDFMRDLEKEVSMMNRTEYEALIDKFERFINRFKMPLSSSTSIGMAIEACSQLQKMMDTVGEISKNTYTTVVFGN